jgi:ferredoxin-NADP reductase
LPSVGALDQVPAEAVFGLRNLPVNIEPDVALAELASFRFRPTGSLAGSLGGSLGGTSTTSDSMTALDACEMTVVDQGDGWIALTSTLGDHSTTAVLFIQPVDSARCVIRGVLTEAPGVDVSAITVLRHHALRLGRWRQRVEAEAAERAVPDPLPVRLQQVPVAHSAAAEKPRPGGRTAGLRTTVARKWRAGEGIAGFELAPLQGELTTFQPGAHIDVHLPNGLVRQYSLVNGPGELQHYVIGVKREPESRGGSACLHDTVREGDVLAISEPRNNFPLRRDAFHTTLIAGGIGITPLLAMAQALHVNRLDFALHYFAQSEDHLAFGDRLETVGDHLTPHLGLDADRTRAELATILAATAGDGHHIYVCGPAPMLDATREIAADLGWPDEAVHFEYFTNTNEIDTSSSFDIELARSALTLTVPAGISIVEVLREHGVQMPTSCEQGACGTCVATVLGGEPDHQDVYLNGTERKAGDRIMTCVSRSRSDRLILDL